jgi:hypothetical protein
LAVPDPNSGGRDIFSTHTDRPRGPPSLLYKGYQVSSREVKRPGVTLTTHPLLTPRFCVRNSTPVRPLCATTACHGMTFTFT